MEVTLIFNMFVHNFSYLFVLKQFELKEFIQKIPNIQQHCLKSENIPLLNKKKNFIVCYLIEYLQ